MLVFSLLVIAQLEQPTYPIPYECHALAQREGFKTEMTKAEAKQAERRLTWLRATRPFNKEIKACKEAVDRMKG